MKQTMDNQSSSNQTVAVLQPPQYINLDNLLEQYGNYQQRNYISEGLLNSNSNKTVIIEMSNLLASVYDNLKNGFRIGELEEYTDMVSRMSRKYKDYPELGSRILEWRKFRRELIETANSTAEKLDQNFSFVNKSRMFGSIVQIFNSLNLGIYRNFCSFISSYAYNISPKLGLLTQSTLELAPHLRFLGFASSFYDILFSQVLINRVVKAMKRDKELFEPLKQWFQETNEFEESVKNLFPYGIDKEIIENIDKALEGIGKEEKIFSAAVLSNVIRDPAISKDGKFLAKVFLFCRSDASKEWYNRMALGDPPADFENCLFYFHRELQQLEATEVDSGSKIEIAKCTAESLDNSTKSPRSILSRLVLCGISGMSVYYCYDNISTSAKHRYSGRLRDLSTNAKLFLEKMDRITV